MAAKRRRRRKSGGRRAEEGGQRTEGGRRRADGGRKDSGQGRCIGGRRSVVAVFGRQNGECRTIGHYGGDGAPPSIQNDSASLSWRALEHRTALTTLAASQFALVSSAVTSTTSLEEIATAADSGQRTED
jgi:hypothetical protein